MATYPGYVPGYVPNYFLSAADCYGFLFDRCLQLFHCANAWAVSGKNFHRLQTVFEQCTSKGLGGRYGWRQ